MLPEREPISNPVDDSSNPFTAMLRLVIEESNSSADIVPAPLPDTESHDANFPLSELTTPNFPSSKELLRRHKTLQTLGGFAFVGGFVVGANVPEQTAEAALAHGSISLATMALGVGAFIRGMIRDDQIVISEAIEENPTQTPVDEILQGYDHAMQGGDPIIEGQKYESPMTFLTLVYNVLQGIGIEKPRTALFRRRLRNH